MLSLGAFRILDKRQSWWKDSDQLPGPCLGGVRGCSMTASDLHQLASCVQSWWECRSGWHWQFCDHRAPLVDTRRHSNDLFSKTPKQPPEKCTFRHAGSRLRLRGADQIAWLIAHELLGRLDGQALLLLEEDPRDKRRGACLAEPLGNQPGDSRVLRGPQPASGQPALATGSSRVAHLKRLPGF